MDVTPLLQSGNWWLIIAGIGITLAAQWAKNKISPPTPTPTPTPAPAPAPVPNPAPLPTPAPAPSTPFLSALAAFLAQLFSHQAAASVGAAASPNALSVEHEAARQMLAAFSAQIAAPLPKA